MVLTKFLKQLAFAARVRARQIINLRHELTTAAHPAHDDLYVVSYPKSGATWMNFLMANIHVLASGSSRRVTFFNVTDFIPDIQTCRDLRANPPLPFPGFRIIKSHAEYNPNYKKVVYIVRDPRDTMVSYFKFAKSLQIFSGDISKFIRDPHFGIDAWLGHLRSWMEDSPVTMRLQMIRYEDLKIDALQTMKRIYFQLGHELQDELLEKAIALSSFKHMKEVEESYGHGGRTNFKDFAFMRKGKSNSWHDELSQVDAKYITSKAGAWLGYFGY